MAVELFKNCTIYLTIVDLCSGSARHTEQKTPPPSKQRCGGGSRATATFVSSHPLPTGRSAHGET